MILTNVSKCKFFGLNDVMVEGQYFYYPSNSNTMKSRYYRAFVNGNKCDIIDITERKPISIEDQLRSIYNDRYDYVDRLKNEFVLCVLKDVRGFRRFI